MKGFCFWTFSSVLFVLLTLLILLQTPSDADPFNQNNSSMRMRLDTLPIADLATYKYKHALAHARFEFGIFGNSRSVAISRRDLGLTIERFFNFSLPGGSVRQSIALLEELARAGKAPHHAIISLDHLELQYFAPPDYPPPLRRWHLSILDVVAVWQDTKNVVISVKVAADRFLLEWDRFKNLFSALKLRNRLAFRLSGSITKPEAVRNTDIDGSREMPPPASEATVFHLVPQVMSLGVPQMVQQDFVRLSTLAKGDITITVYESPLAPEALRDRAPAPDAVLLRSQITNACNRFNFSCYLKPPVLAGAVKGLHSWPDCCHAPTKILASYLKSFLNLPVTVE